MVPVKVVTEQVQSFEANNTLLGPVGHAVVRGRLKMRTPSIR
jgi:hypothetical protein